MSPAGPSGVPRLDFERAPFTIIWEVTRACRLRCAHCRADAQWRRDPRELSTAEGRALIDQIASLGSPVFVITGGDPLERPDLFTLIAHAARRGVAVAVTPSGTPRLTAAAVRRMAGAGARRMALSLDGPSAAVHDGFRGVPGSFDWTAAAAREATACGLSVQINTTVTQRNLSRLPEIAQMVEDLGAATWSAFFLVTVGRARQADQLDAQQCEAVFGFLHDLSARAPFAVRTTAAPHYRRFVMEREVEARRRGAPRRPPAKLLGTVGDLPRARVGVTDGNGLAFVSHTGAVYPSGFLPLCTGSVRDAPLGDIYREAPLFRLLRDHDALGGKCGICPFRRVCGGSRARAWAAAGDPMGEDPLCAYEPRVRSGVRGVAEGAA